MYPAIFEQKSGCMFCKKLQKSLLDTAKPKPFQ